MGTGSKWRHSRCVNNLLPDKCNDRVIELLNMSSASKGITIQTQKDKAEYEWERSKRAVIFWVERNSERIRCDITPEALEKKCRAHLKSDDLS